jgi:hypothetical protein
VWRVALARLSHCCQPLARRTPAQTGWTGFLDIFLGHYGVEVEEEDIVLFVGIIPIAIDVLFKYWIFIGETHTSVGVGVHACLSMARSICGLTHCRRQIVATRRAPRIHRSEPHLARRRRDH